MGSGLLKAGVVGGGGGGGGGSPADIVLFQWNRTDTSQFSQILTPGTGSASLTFATGTDGISPVLRVSCTNTVVGGYAFGVTGLVLPRRWMLRIRYPRNDGNTSAEMGWLFMTSNGQNGILEGRISGLGNNNSARIIGGAYTALYTVQAGTSVQIANAFPGNFMNFEMVWNAGPYGASAFPYLGLSPINDYSQDNGASGGTQSTITRTTALTDAVWSGLTLNTFAIGGGRSSAVAAQTMDIADITIYQHYMDWTI